MNASLAGQAAPTRRTRAIAAVFESARDALAVLLPTQCAGCGDPNRSLCMPCTAALSPAVREWTISPATTGGGEPEHSTGPVATPLPPFFPPLSSLPLFSALNYEGRVRRVLYAYKDSGRADVAGSLAPAMRAAVEACLFASASASASRHGVEIVAIPSSRAARRRRGYNPVGLVLRAAGLVPAPVLRHARQPEDQSSLGRVARWANLAGSLTAPVDLHGRAFLVVDDILTTGATVWEASRALQMAGADVLGAATIAHTPRLYPLSGGREDR